MTLFGDVVFPLPLAKSFLYSVPESLAGRAFPGVRVRAPLGRKVLTGFLTAVSGNPPEPGFAVKALLDVLDDGPLFTPSFLEFTAALAAAHLASQGEFLEAALPPAFVPVEAPRAVLTPAGRQALEEGALAPREREAALILARKPYAPRYLERRLGGTGVPSLLRRLVRKGLVELRADPPKARRFRDGREAAPRPPLQLEIGFGEPVEVPQAVADAEAALAAGRHRELYLWGGHAARRSVLVRLVRRALGLGGRALILVPEIAPAEALIAELRRFLGEEAAVFHSRLTPSSREAEWRKLREGRAVLAAGPRSALFAPLDGLRLAAVEGEHDESLVQEESPAYDAREGARLRARAEGAVLVLGSATPSVAAFHRAAAAGVLAELGAEPRRNRVSIVADDGRSGILAPALREKVARRLAAGDRVILFLNRRGTAFFVVCARCGEVPRCPRCRFTLSLHARENALVCHACGFRMAVPDGCPDCPGRLRVPRRTGIQALEEEVRKLFPGVPAASFDADSVRGRADGDAVLEKFGAGRLPLLVGTGMLARRLEAPAARLVGIIAPETSLGLPDYRAAERTHAAVARMLEFAEDDPSAEAVVQTAAPGHHAIAAAAARDYRAFYDREIELRRLLRTPPFASVAEAFFRGKDARALARRARDAAARLKAAAPEVEILGPALAPAGPGRSAPGLQLTLRADDREALLAALRALMAAGRAGVSLRFLD